MVACVRTFIDKRCRGNGDDSPFAVVAHPRVMQCVDMPYVLAGR
jgi:hypothetical protein